MEMSLLFLYNGLKGMKKPFEIIDHTADVGIIAYGADVEELFSNAALALFSLITEPERIEEKLHLDLEVSSEDRDSLLIEWLNELIYLFDVKHILFNRFDIESLTHNDLKATCYGEDFDPLKHKIKIGVKAATYHMLRLEKNGSGYKSQIILDI
jgi:SHS2 domain-containing protein